RGAVLAGNRPVRQDALDGFEAMDLGGQTIGHRGVDRNLRLRALRWRRERRSNLEEILLDALRECGDLDVLADRSRKSETRVQLVDRPVGLNARGALRHAHPAREAGFPTVSPHRADTHDAVLLPRRNAASEAKSAPLRSVSSFVTHHPASCAWTASAAAAAAFDTARSEEHTSELQSLAYLVCRLLLEK